MGRRPRVLLVGAYERDNFGDLLFLLVTERYLDGVDVVAAAPFAADMRALLDREIPAYGPLLQRESFDAVWTVGGQVGLIDLRRAYRLSAGREQWATFAAAPEAEQRAILSAAVGGAPVTSPYIPSLLAYPRNAGAAGILNSVGLAGIRDMEPIRRAEIVASLRGATAIAVRDAASSRLLAELGIDHRLVPDAVHALPLVHPASRDDADDTAVVQISSAMLARLGHTNVGAAIASSPQLAGRPIRLLLAGTATGHDSVGDYELVVRAAHRHSRGLDIAIVEERRPLELVDRIRRARVVIGSSLHVRIVACAYGVPRVSLQRAKLTRYARTWDPAMPFDVAPESLDGAVDAAIAHAATAGAAEHSAALARDAHENLERLAGLVRTTAADGVADRLAERRHHQLETLARQFSAQQAEIERLRHELGRLQGPRWSARLRPRRHGAMTT